MNKKRGPAAGGGAGKIRGTPNHSTATDPLQQRSKFRELDRGERCTICGHNRRCKVAADSGDLRLCFRASDERVNGFRRIKQTGECTTYVRIDSPADQAGAKFTTHSRSVGDLNAAAKRYAQAMTDERLQTMADQLGVSAASLRAIDAGLNGDRLCFPERNADGSVVGINTRLPDGRKLVGKGQHRGLIIPTGFAELPDPVLIPEGPTDTAACVTMGLAAVGRPMAKGGLDQLAELLRDRPDVIIVGENDPKADGTWPGRDGTESMAGKLAETWRRPVAWVIPTEGIKDVREHLCQHNGTDPIEIGRELCAYLRDNLIWETPDQRKRKRAPSQADGLVRMAERAELFHAPGEDGEAYATFVVGNHRETWRIASKGFRQWLGRLFYVQTKKTPSAQALEDAINVIIGKAIFAGPEREAPVRIAEHNGAIWLDLTNDKWEAVEITANGWRVVPSVDVPARFIRRRGTLTLPEPKHDGTIDGLRSFVNVSSDDDWILLVAFLVAALRPTGPYPVLAVSGEQGSAKSTLCRLVRSLVDPNQTALRRPPKDDRDLMIAASNAWIVGYDNLSKIPAGLSDTLSSLATGGGFATRELYSDDEEKLFNAARPIILNGIEDAVSRSDLMDRAIFLTLPTIDETGRRDQAELWGAFDRAQPQILGALLDGVSAALRNVDSVQLDRLPRMADFAKWATAAEPGLCWEPGTFIRAYAGNREAANDLAIEGSAVGPAILAMVRDCSEWQGTAGELLTALETNYADDKTRSRPGWPKTATRLGGIVRRLAPNLRAVGVGVVFDERTPDRKRRRVIRLEKKGILASDVSAASGTAPEGPKTGDSFGPPRTGADARTPTNRPQENPDSGPVDGASDTSDGSDDVFPTYSGPSANGSDALAAVPDGWPRHRWATELDRKAGVCEQDHPDIAARYREQAAAIREQKRA